ncbi:carbohydrate sulfotransferase 11-like [Penaeus chinensis]|uniref:carbohydrate sulfotransferase 11-like n=1 Tax=Penaeus chinensis TaxID=139456 RepID=UPI001FB7456F|nr:carbohydrate sulfotransferase 11-like [Penaeus chinensis]
MTSAKRNCMAGIERLAAQTLEKKMPARKLVGLSVMTAAFLFIANVGIRKTATATGPRPVGARGGGLAEPLKLTNIFMTEVIPKSTVVLESNEMRNFKSRKGRPAVLQPSNAEELKNIDFSRYNSEDRSLLEARLPVLVRRARQVGEVCRSSRLPLRTHQPPRFLWDKTHSPSIVWCPIYKVASTTWLINFLRLAHFNENNTAIPSNVTKEEQDMLRLTHRYGASHHAAFAAFPSPGSPRAKARALRESVRVIIVRHPFTRILSAYRDKMTKLKPLPLKYRFRDLQKAIIAKYRSPKSTDNSTFPTFAEFVQYVIDSTEDLGTAKEWLKVKCWRPYWVHCSVCSTDYNIIMKLETMREDEQFLITLSSLSELKSQATWKHLRGNSSAQLADGFFAQLTRRQMAQLYRRYQQDFELFQYDIKDYLAKAKADDSQVS